MSYQFTKKQEFFKKNMQTFMRQKIGPQVTQIDQQEEFPYEVLNQMAGNRLLGLLVPREEGGEGAGFLDLCLALEEMAKACPTSALVCSVQNLGAHLLSREGSPGQKDRYMASLMAGKAVFGYAIPDSISLDPMGVSVSVLEEGNGFVLDGPGFFVVNGDIADCICLFGKNGETLSSFLVEKDSRGLRVNRQEGTSGAEARSACRAILERCAVPVEGLLGEKGKGEGIMADIMAESACFTSARALGIAHGAMEYAAQYSKKREQFGRPLGTFQAIQVMLANMCAKVEAARHLVYKTATVFDEKNKDRFRLASIAKYFTSKMAMEVTTDAVQIGGGYFYTRDYPLEKMMRNAELSQILDGVNHSHALAIARYL